TTVHEIADFYECKTQAVLRRYGPGPRVHYRTGFADEVVPARRSAGLRRQIVASQERVLQYAAEFWQVRHVPFLDVLDVGCGLGGGAIFWAQEFGARVTAATIAPTHVELVAKFAAQAGVGALVHPILCDASAVPGERCFDAALALDSSDTFPRAPWFDRVAALLRPRGHVFIYDCFLERPEYAEPINRHWCAQIGPLEEYFEAARAAGLRPDLFEDVSARTREFWTLTIALAEAEKREEVLNSWERARLEESFEVHRLVRQGLYDGGLRYALLSFVED
ncbi:MAG TPA: methyltransferase domain-containing protein, partial [Candidatus Binatia bacterium]|nr:methyltransferase domain-containing protein [Candidatus Binatia bacterium]